MKILLDLPYISCALLIGFGVYAAIFKSNLIKIVIGLSLVERGVNLFLVSLGYREGARAPIFTYAPTENMVLPTPQALTLTSIVIGLATTALMLAFCIQVYRKHGTLESDRIARKLKEKSE